MRVATRSGRRRASAVARLDTIDLTAAGVGRASALKTAALLEEFEHVRAMQLEALHAVSRRESVSRRV